MIRGIDFYAYCLREIKQHPNFHFLQGKIDNVFSGIETGVVVGGEKIHSKYVFNSILFGKPTLGKSQHWLLQHFKGWRIKTAEPVFDSRVATLMDFRISQAHGTSFCYLLPYSDTEALVEYTLFTPAVLKNEEYDEQLENYLKEILHISDYTITDTEFGVIPMTNYRFRQKENNIVNIGTAGGQTKGSSGYTFYFIQKHCKAIVEQLAQSGKPFTASASQRHHFYDSVLLSILQNNTLPGKQIFSTLFEKNNVTDVLHFLNNESSLLQELKIISSLPTLPFLKAALKQSF
jgi:lycopene beta-cyclase